MLLYLKKDNKVSIDERAWKKFRRTMPSSLACLRRFLINLHYNNWGFVRIWLNFRPSHKDMHDMECSVHFSRGPFISLSKILRIYSLNNLTKNLLTWNCLHSKWHILHLSVCNEAQYLLIFKFEMTWYLEPSYCKPKKENLAWNIFTLFFSFTN